MIETTTASGGSSSTLDIINPATLIRVARVPNTSLAEVDRLLERAQAAAVTWRAVAPERRAELLWQWSILVDENLEQLARLDVDSTGKVLRDALAETRRGSRYMRYWAGMADKITGDYLPEPAGRFSYSMRVPLGVYAIVLPWNGPAHSFMARSLPALAAGNAIVVKPSEFSPLSAQRLGELATEAGIPAGVVTVVTGDGSVGAHIVQHPIPGGISFTGSVATGRQVGREGAGSLKKMTLELGGKSPMVVFDDADLGSAVDAAVVGILMNAGQICAASSRLLVQAGIADEFVQRLVERMRQVQVGDPTRGVTQLGPLVNERQFEKVNGLIRDGVAEGAQLLCGGPADIGEVTGHGLFVAPTVFGEVDDAMTIAREEIFGPVLGVSRFDTEHEAIERANGHDMGLAAYIWTADVGRMLRMADALEAGAVHGNTPLVMDASLPFGGLKGSGVGNAYGAGAIDGCTETKRVTIRTESGPLRHPWFDETAGA